MQLDISHEKGDFISQVSFMCTQPLCNNIFVKMDVFIFVRVQKMSPCPLGGHFQRWGWGLGRRGRRKSWSLFSLIPKHIKEWQNGQHRLPALTGPHSGIRVFIWGPQCSPSAFACSDNILVIYQPEKHWHRLTSVDASSGAERCVLEVTVAMVGRESQGNSSLPTPVDIFHILTTAVSIPEQTSWMSALLACIHPQ